MEIGFCAGTDLAKRSPFDCGWIDREFRPRRVGTKDQIDFLLET